MLFFYSLPPLLYFVRHQIALRVVFILLFSGLLFGAFLLKSPGFDRRKLRRLHTLGPHLKSMLSIFLPCSAILTFAVFVFLPDHFLYFSKSKPYAWLSTMIFYPIFLAAPQELIFRGFFFHRYGMLFGDPRLAILFNALSFGLAHAFYGNWVAPLLSFFGGLLLAWRYHVSSSIPLAVLEHAIWETTCSPLESGVFSIAARSHEISRSSHGWRRVRPKQNNSLFVVHSLSLRGF